MKSIKRSKTRKWKGRILDLHKVKHEEVPFKVFNFLYENIDKNRMPVEIITGRSGAMLEKVKGIVDHMGYLSVRDCPGADKIVVDVNEDVSNLLA